MEDSVLRGTVLRRIYTSGVVDFCKGQSIPLKESFIRNRATLDLTGGRSEKALSEKG